MIIKMFLNKKVRKIINKINIIIILIKRKYQNYLSKFWNLKLKLRNNKLINNLIIKFMINNLIKIKLINNF